MSTGLSSPGDHPGLFAWQAPILATSPLDRRLALRVDAIKLVPGIETAERPSRGGRMPITPAARRHQDHANLPPTPAAGRPVDGLHGARLLRPGEAQRRHDR